LIYLHKVGVIRQRSVKENQTVVKIFKPVYPQVEL